MLINSIIVIRQRTPLSNVRRRKNGHHVWAIIFTQELTPSPSRCHVTGCWPEILDTDPGIRKFRAGWLQRWNGVKNWRDNGRLKFDLQSHLLQKANRLWPFWEQLADLGDFDSWDKRHIFHVPLLHIKESSLRIQHCWLGVTATTNMHARIKTSWRRRSSFGSTGNVIFLPHVVWVLSVDLSLTFFPTSQATYWKSFRKAPNSSRS